MAPFGGLGRAIFFSGRSFATRADLLSAVIPLSPFESDHQEFLKAILKKARQFSAGRNAIAHGIPVNLHSHDESYTGPKVKEGRTSWESGGIGIDALLMAQINFNSLAEIIEQAVFPSAQREEYLLRVQALPNEAFVRG